MWVWHCKMLKISKWLRIFGLKTLQKFITNLRKNPRKYSEDGQMKYFKQTFNSMDYFIMSLVVSYVGSWSKSLRVYWYRSIKPFRTNLKLVLKEYLCIWHESFPGVDSYSSDLMSSGMIKYTSSYNFN